MSEVYPLYRVHHPPEYFFLKTAERLFRIRVPWLSVQMVIGIIESPQGPRELEISYGFIPGPEIIWKISEGAASHLLELAEEEGWIE